MQDNPSEAEDLEQELALPDEEGMEHTTARRLALQILYEVSSTAHPRGVAITNQLARYTLREKTRNYVYELVNGVSAYAADLDEIIESFASDWPMDQMAIVDRAVLHIALYEGLVLKRAPVSVYVKEALILTEAFGSESAIKFVNGVLGNAFDNRKRLRKMLEARRKVD